jgi:hypothetical protein
MCLIVNGIVTLKLISECLLGNRKIDFFRQIYSELNLFLIRKNINLKFTFGHFMIIYTRTLV